MNINLDELVAVNWQRVENVISKIPAENLSDALHEIIDCLKDEEKHDPKKYENYHHAVREIYWRTEREQKTCIDKKVTDQILSYFTTVALKGHSEKAYSAITTIAQIKRTAKTKIVGKLVEQTLRNIEIESHYVDIQHYAYFRNKEFGDKSLEPVIDYGQLYDLLRMDPDDNGPIFASVPQKEIPNFLKNLLNFLEHEESGRPMDYHNAMCGIKILFGNADKKKISNELAERTLTYLMETAATDRTELQYSATLAANVVIGRYPYSPTMLKEAEKVFTKIAKESPRPYTQGHANMLVQSLKSKT